MPTTDELLDLAPQIGQRQSTVRWDVLDVTLTSVDQGAITPRADSTPTVAVNGNAAIKRTLSTFRLTPADQASLNPFADRLRPTWVLENGAEFPLGVFLLGSLDRLRFEYGLEAEVACVDQTLIVDTPITQSVALAAGDSLRSAIETQLAAAGVPLFDVDATITTSISAPIAWPVGTSRLRIVNDLAAMAGAFALYFDNAGVGRIRRARAIADETATLIYREGGRIITGSMVETDDLLDAPNRYLVIDSGAAEFPIVGLYDIPADAPHSQANRGFVVARVIDAQGLGSADQALAQAKAAYEADHGGFQWAQFSSPPDPRHDTFDAVDYLGVVYREQSWSLPLAEGAEMTHDLRRTYT